MRIATWNLEQAHPNSAAGRTQAEQIADIRADVWIFTEAPDGLRIRRFDIASSEPMLTSEAAYFATIMGCGLLERPLPEVPTGAAALVVGRQRPVLVVGVCMPWRRGAPELPPTAAPAANTGSEQWSIVMDRLERAVTRLRVDHPDADLVIAGDFNQTSAGLMVGSREGRRRLDRLAAGNDVVIHTANLASAVPGANAVDHILAKPTAKVRVVTPGVVQGRKRTASDHAAYVLDL